MQNGDGAIAPDGSPVPIYLAMAAEPTFTPVLERLPATASVLAHVDARAHLVRSRIEGLDLGRRFDAVVLPSHLVNVPDGEQRRAMLATVRRHLAPRGEAYVQHHDVASDRYQVGTTVQQVATPAGTLELATTIHQRRGSRLQATTTMTLDGESWPQRYETELLDPAALAAELAATGLEPVATPTSTWTIVRPTD